MSCLMIKWAENGKRLQNRKIDDEGLKYIIYMYIYRYIFSYFAWSATLLLKKQKRLHYRSMVTTVLFFLSCLPPFSFSFHIMYGMERTFVDLALVSQKLCVIGFQEAFFLHFLHTLKDTEWMNKINHESLQMSFSQKKAENVLMRKITF